jgi:hypothetical protein
MGAALVPKNYLISTSRNPPFLIPMESLTRREELQIQELSLKELEFVSAASLGENIGAGAGGAVGAHVGARVGATIGSVAGFVGMVIGAGVGAGAGWALARVMPRPLIRHV